MNRGQLMRVDLQEKERAEQQAEQEAQAALETALEQQQAALKKRGEDFESEEALEKDAEEWRQLKEPWGLVRHMKQAAGEQLQRDPACWWVRAA